MTQKFQVPQQGSKITVNADFSLNVPDNPIIPFIEGDGTGVDITPVMRKVVDAAVDKAYGGKRKIAWMEVYAGEKATKVYDADTWLPDETVQAIREYVVSIKGPLTTPVSGGIRSLNVALRQMLDLYVCLRPVRYFQGVPSPVKEPEKVDMVIFRENTEDIYAGIEWEANSEEAKKVIAFLQNEMGVKKIRFPESSAIGIKPVSIEGSERLVRRAIQYAIDNKRSSVTLVHKGNIMKFTEGGFKKWGYELAAARVRRRTAGRRAVDETAQWHRDQGRDRRRLPAADPAAAGRIRRDRHPEPERRLHLRRAGGAGGRHRHRAGGQSFRQRGDVRGHPRHRAQVCRQGLCQSRFPHPVGRDDAAPHGLDRSGRSDRQVDGESHRRENRDLRFCTADARRDPGFLFGFRSGDDSADVRFEPAYRPLAVPGFFSVDRVGFGERGNACASQ